MSNFILEKGPVCLLPYTPEHAALPFAWQFDKRYAEFFRNSGFMTLEEFKVYPQRINGLAFVIYVDSKPIGMIQAIPQALKNNKSFFAGILLEEEFQAHNYGVLAYDILFSALFNKYGYEKGIVEVLAHRKEIISRLNSTGFLFEGLLKNEVFFEGKYCDEVRYAMSRTFYNKHHNKG